MRGEAALRWGAFPVSTFHPVTENHHADRLPVVTMSLADRAKGILIGEPLPRPVIVFELVGSAGR